MNGAILLDGSLLDMALVELHIFDGPLAVGDSPRDLRISRTRADYREIDIPSKRVEAAGVLGVVLEEGLVFRSGEWKFKRLKEESHNRISKRRIP